MPLATISYQKSCFRSVHGHGSTGVFLVGILAFYAVKHAQNMPLATISYPKSCETAKTASTVLGPLAACIFMCLKLVQVVIVT